MRRTSPLNATASQPESERLTAGTNAAGMSRLQGNRQPITSAGKRARCMKTGPTCQSTNRDDVSDIQTYLVMIHPTRAAQGKAQAATQREPEEKPDQMAPADEVRRSRFQSR